MVQNIADLYKFFAKKISLQEFEFRHLNQKLIKTQTNQKARHHSS